LLKLLLIPLFLYCALLLLVFALQTRMLFPVRAVGAAAPLPAGAERLELDTPAGHRLHGVRIPAEERDSPSFSAEGDSAGRGGTAPLLVLGFGGNAWNAEHAAAYLHDLYPEAEIVAFHYRGYAPSAGEPGAEALVEDAPLVHDLAVGRLKPARTVAVGFSIGSGVAASLAARRPLAGLILVTPFDSLAEVAAGHYPWLPVRLLFRHRLDAAAALRGTSVPTAIIAAERDTLIPARRTDALRRAVPNLVFDRTIAGASHNDIYDRPAFRQAMREALNALPGTADVLTPPSPRGPAH
jgi:pimeloyl-ACP methyl ester carboxylesterase